MRKIVLILLLLLIIKPVLSNDKSDKKNTDKEVYEVSYFQNSIGVNLGCIYKNNFYEYMGFSYPILKSNNGTLKYGVGYFFNDVFVSTNLGLYYNKLHNRLYLNTGIETGFRVEPFIMGISYNINDFDNYIGLKIGIIIK